jgi:hypothetical protein
MMMMILEKALKPVAGHGAKALRRRPRMLDIDAFDDRIAAAWIHGIQQLVRWQARAPPIHENRRIRVVVNPHSGKRQAPKVSMV